MKEKKLNKQTKKYYQIHLKHDEPIGVEERIAFFVSWTIFAYVNIFECVSHHTRD